MDRHQKMIDTMLGLYCQAHHETKQGLCADGTELLAYATERLSRCPFQPNKPPCSKCPVHCYKPAMREKMRNVMRYAGPRMIGKHPIMAVQHLIDG